MQLLLPDQFPLTPYQKFINIVSMKNLSNENTKN